MNTAKSKLKADLRSKIRKVLKNFPPEKRRLDSEKLCAKLKEQSFYQNAASILFFAPLPNEVDLWPSLEESLMAKKIVALPRFDLAGQSYVVCRVENLQSEIVSGQFGIREPSLDCVEIPLDTIDLVLVPGIAFDSRGNRLGRGRGFYDQLLQDFRGKKAGVAFDEQVVDAVPVEKADVKMDFVVTPTRCVKVGR
jgi:5-formyltetrahydrofolate cyclo-ligase